METHVRANAAPIVLGAVAFGKPKPTTKDHPLSTDEACEALLAEFVASGGGELDTARVYQNGNCEGVLGRIEHGKKVRIATKYHPSLPGGPLQQLNESLAALQQDSVPIYYIHMPATEIPLEDTLAEIDQGHKQGKFVEFGLSNFPAWQVVEVAQYCKSQGYVPPTVYQGVYNALNRSAEYELVPVLRNYGIKYYTHGSLASGFLTGKYKQGVAPVPGVDRFAQRRRIKQYEERYLHREEMFSALHGISAAAENHDISVLEAAIRWTQNHSAVDAACGDAVLIGVSRQAQLAPIMRAAANGPLPEPVVEAFEVAHEILQMKSEYYLQYPYPKEGSPWRSR
ncbi:MAG: aldo/keto reductase [Pseudomonadota bacterium]